MGREIATHRFSEADFKRFYQCLEAETASLEDMLKTTKNGAAHYTVGLELEAWLLEPNMRPSAVNEFFLSQLNDDMVNAELAKFNVEFNTHPTPLNNQVLKTLQKQLQNAWSSATQQAQRLNNELMMIGILPTLQQKDLTLKQMSILNRYHALNEQILSSRNKPIELDIHGHEHLKLTHHDVMLESAATSLQMHTKVPIETAHYFYNASILASAAVVGVAGNAPFLFGKRLWHETRIPLFEQAIETGGYNGAAHGPIKRVSFGTDFAHQHIFECFQENLAHFPILLPAELDDMQPLAHLRLHNGTIWRWNRPLVGFNQDDSIHVRIEHRTPAAGPTVIDTIANAAFYFGLSHAIYQDLLNDKTSLTFSQARDNFYKAAHHGLNATVTGFNGQNGKLQKVISEQCLDKAFDALIDLGLDSQQVSYFISIIENRVKTKQTGSDWQIAFVDKYGRDFTQLSKVYLYHQQQGIEVSQWPV